MYAYYNEIDPFAASWLRELIKGGHIAPGEVDTRSIEDVIPTDLAGFSQCHFFAGIGVWSYALRRAGWPDSRPVWTGSCPCQPFSAAGKRTGTADERHLWPAFHHLIRQRRPVTVFGEQVASRDGLAWFDLVQADMEAAGYACGAVDTCAAGFGAPHIRQRLYWVADADGKQRHRGRFPEAGGGLEFADGGTVCRLADAAFRRNGPYHGQSDKGFRPQEPTGGYGFSGGLADADIERSQGRSRMLKCSDKLLAGQGGLVGGEDSSSLACFWRDADWLLCRDGRWRPVEPGTFPLVDGASARVGRLRGYGNAIVAPQAEAFIRAFLNH